MALIPDDRQEETNKMSEALQSLEKFDPEKVHKFILFLVKRVGAVLVNAVIPGYH